MCVWLVVWVIQPETAAPMLSTVLWKTVSRRWMVPDSDHSNSSTGLRLHLNHHTGMQQPRNCVTFKYFHTLQELLWDYQRQFVTPHAAVSASYLISIPRNCNTNKFQCRSQTFTLSAVPQSTLRLKHAITYHLSSYHSPVIVIFFYL